MKQTIFALLFSITLNFAAGQEKLTIDRAGLHLRQFYLRQNVENLWLPGHHINWETGIPDDPNAHSGIKTHCSAFVASVCEQKDIYILRPPAHKTVLLASAQYNWLFTDEGESSGWRQITDSVYEKAQRLANKGYIVVAVYRNNDPKKPGHIAFVMPFEKQTDSLAIEGPTLIQAGQVNKNFISLKEGFKHHITDCATATQVIAFFYNSHKL